MSRFEGWFFGEDMQVVRQEWLATSGLDWRL
jgi:hypothetical protein